VPINTDYNRQPPPSRVGTRAQHKNGDG